MKNAYIFDTHRATTSDGPGMRTTIFFQGCPLNCKWCQNPEGISFTPQLMWDKNKCIGCMTCVNTCHSKAIEITKSEIVINRELCDSCGECVEVCPSKAIHFCSRKQKVDEIVKLGLKDKPYYIGFGGGVTFSGGEAMAHPLFVRDASKALHNNKVSVALDTSGYAPWEDFLQVLPYIDVVLYDLKIINSDKHKEFIGKSNELILSNFNKLLNLKKTKRSDLTIWIRTPLIPGATDSIENIMAIGKTIGEFSKYIERWELCNFNNLGSIKYKKLDLDWDYKNTPLYSVQEVATILEYARESVNNSVAVVNSGLMKLKE